MLLTGNAAVDKTIKTEIAGSQTLNSQHQVIAEWNYNAYSSISEIGCFYLSNGSYVKDGYFGAQSYYYSDNITELDNHRETYSPLKSIFETNRPKPGIIHSTYLDQFAGKSLNGDSDASISLSIKDMFNMSTDNPRLYPISKDSIFKYWSSGRTSNSKKVGVSKLDYSINYASPYIEYTDPIYINKIVVKTQKHLGYVRSFQIDVKNESGSWETVYFKNNSSLLEGGELSIYYNYSGNSWTLHSNAIDQPNEYSINNFDINSNQVKKIYGLRFIAKKMSKTHVPLEMIELSPRLVADLTNSTVSFDCRSALSSSSYGLPIGSIISSNGSIKLSNENGYFSKNNESSILYNVLKPNVEFRFYQKLNIDGTEYRFPLKTLYTDIWNEQDDFTVSIQLEDYFKFFREQMAPDLMIANKNGIPTSNAMLIFMDNVGFNSFRFEKVDSTQYVDKEDIILDFFYSKKEDTVMQVLEQLAISTQTAIYMDADNDLVAMTKEKMVQKQDIKDFWMIGDNGLVNKESYYDGVDTTSINYIANIEGLTESSEPPITDITVQYNGLGFEKQSMALVGKDNASVKANQDTLERSDFGMSTINQNLRYTSDILWQPGNDEKSKDNSLAAAALIQDIPEDRPTLVIHQKSYENYTKEDVIKTLVNSGNDNIRNSLCIYLDKSYINTFTNNFSGYILIDSELIKYYGIAYFVSDPLTNSFKKEVYFSTDEYLSAKAKLGQGGSIEPIALVIDLDFRVNLSLSNSGKNIFFLSDDGRGQQKTKIVSHRGINTHKDFLSANTDWHKNGTNLWGKSKSLPKVIVNNLTVTDRKETYLSNSTMHFNSFQQSFNGNIKLSGPKCKGSLAKTNYAGSVKAEIPAKDSSEQIITGIVKTIKDNNGNNVPIKRIGTRMRLISDVPKNVNPGDKTINSGVVAGIAWDVKEYSGIGMTGYFLEVEDVGTIDGKSLASAKYRNLRLYKIELNANWKYVPKLLGNAWVNVSSTPNASIDYAMKPSDGKTYAQIFDLEVTIRDGARRQYEVVWEGQNVLTVSESNASVLDSTSKACLFVRGQSSAVFENLYVYSSPGGINLQENKNIGIDYFYGRKTSFSRCYLPTGVTSVLGTSGKQNILYFEEFGRFVREVKKFDVRFNQSALNPKLISLAGFNTNYYTADFETSSNGATFWLYNTSNGPINLDDASGTPLWISGFQLKKISGGSIESSKLMERENNSKALDDIYQTNRNIYGKQELQLSGEFINNRGQAENIARWVVTKLKQERTTLSLSIFPNPILKLGDKIGVQYSDKYYTDPKTYTITAIDHSISNSGPTMNIELKECV